MTKLILCFLLLSFTINVKSQANLTIENNSQRVMTVKIMKGMYSPELYKTVTISAHRSVKINFNETDYYFTKSKAILEGKDPVYMKGDPFEVINDYRGYSELTITYSITESTIPMSSGGKKISKAEFDKN
jgi:hypothetical protein